MRLAIVAAFAFALSACATSTTRAIAAKDFGCAEKEVHVQRTGDGFAMEASGCGRQAIYIDSAFQAPIERASFDLSCPPAQLQMSYLGRDQVGVNGCGRHASYAWFYPKWVGGAVPN